MGKDVFLHWRWRLQVPSQSTKTWEKYSAVKAAAILRGSLGALASWMVQGWNSWGTSVRRHGADEWRLYRSKKRGSVDYVTYYNAGDTLT